MYKDILNFEGIYQISDKGEVQICKTGKALKCSPCTSGYPMAKLYKGMDEQTGKRIYKYIRVHRLVALHFLPNPKDYPIINHKDGNKTNNNVANLEWCTYSHNMAHAIHAGLHKVNKTLSDTDLQTCRNLYIQGTPMKELCEQFGVTRKAIAPWIFDDSPEILQAKQNNFKSRAKQSGKLTAKAVKQLSIENQVIKVWDSSIEAAKALGVNQGNISNVCRGRSKTCGGYKWEYA